MSHLEIEIKERRQSKRWNLKVPLRVFTANHDVCIGHVLDISLHGIKVASERQFDEADEMAFDLEIPDTHGQWRKTCVRVYCIPDASGGLFYTGFKFLKVEPEILMRVQPLIDDQSPFS